MRATILLRVPSSPGAPEKFSSLLSRLPFLPDLTLSVFFRTRCYPPCSSRNILHSSGLRCSSRGSPSVCRTAPSSGDVFGSFRDYYGPFFGSSHNRGWFFLTHVHRFFVFCRQRSPDPPLRSPSFFFLPSSAPFFCIPFGFRFILGLSDFHERHSL